MRLIQQGLVVGVCSMGLRKLLYAANDKVGHEPNDDQRPGGRDVGPDPGFEARPAVQAGPGFIHEPLEEPSAQTLTSLEIMVAIMARAVRFKSLVQPASVPIDP